MRTSVAMIAVLVLANSLSAQQSGDGNRNYTINGQGGLQASVVASSVGGLMANVYDTVDPGAPILWALASGASIGWATTPSNSIDIGPSGLTFLLNGLDPSSPLAFFLQTSSSGSFGVSFSVPSPLVGSNAYFAMAHVAASAPEGFWVSQTHNTTFVAGPSCGFGATNLGLGDDTTAGPLPMGFSVPFYGTSYTDLYVGSNGILTFGNANAGFEFAPTFFLSAFEPQVAVWTTDWNPGSAAPNGGVFFSTDNVSHVSVCWQDVPEFCGSSPDSFSVALDADPLSFTITYTYDAVMNSSAQCSDILVGLTPGSNLAAGLPLDLSAGAQPIAPGSAPYEHFFFGGPAPDLAGRTITFVMDPTNGEPTLVF